MEIHKGQKRWLFASVSLTITLPWFTCIIWEPSRRLFNCQRCRGMEGDGGGAAKRDGQWAAIFKGVQEAVKPKCCRTSWITLRVFRRVARVQMFKQQKIGNWKVDVWYTDVEHRVMANAASTTNPRCIEEQKWEVVLFLHSLSTRRSVFTFSLRFAARFTCKIVCVQCPFQLYLYIDAWGKAFNRKEPWVGPEKQTPYVQIPKTSMQTWAGLCVWRTLDVKNMFVDNSLKVQFTKETCRKRHI